MTSKWPHSNDNWDDDDDDNDFADGAPELDGLLDYTDYSWSEGDSANEFIVDSDSNGALLLDESQDTVQTVLVTGRGPSGAVAASAFIDGRVFQVNLSPQVATMTESELAAEIVAVCTLTSRQADATRHHILATLMSELGQDPVSSRAFLEHTIGLPSPQTVLDEKARMFADYYSDRDQGDQRA